LGVIRKCCHEDDGIINNWRGIFLPLAFDSIDAMMMKAFEQRVSTEDPIQKDCKHQQDY
jgi:hypothetical protein